MEKYWTPYFSVESQKLTLIHCMFQETLYFWKILSLILDNSNAFPFKTMKIKRSCVFNSVISLEREKF